MNTKLLETIGVTPQVEQKILNIWKPKNMELHIPIFDLQHLWLLFLIIEAEESFGKKNEEEMFQKLSFELTNYVVEHFTLEEKLFTDYNFPDFNNHKVQHLKFIEFLSEKFNFSLLQNKTKRKELVSFLWEWLEEHFFYDDQQYKQFIEQMRIDINTWFKNLLQNKVITIDRSQLYLYKHISQSSQLTEEISDTIFKIINNLWYVYNLKIDIPILDLQHLWLIRLIVELDFACKNFASKKREVVFHYVVKNTIQYIAEHFSLEEKIMQKFSPSEYSLHARQHAGFVNFLQERIVEFSEGNTQAASNLLRDLKEWLYGHIAVIDKRMSNNLRVFHGEIANYVNELIHKGELKLRKPQIDLYNKIMKIQYF